MAKTSKKSRKTVGKALHKAKRGKLKRGRGGKGGTVKSRKQAIAIGLSEARKKGEKVPKRKKKAAAGSRKKAAGGRKKKAAGGRKKTQTSRRKRRKTQSRTRRARA